MKALVLLLNEGTGTISGGLYSISKKAKNQAKN